MGAKVLGLPTTSGKRVSPRLSEVPAGCRGSTLYGVAMEVRGVTAPSFAPSGRLLTWGEGYKKCARIASERLCPCRFDVGHRE